MTVESLQNLKTKVCAYEDPFDHLQDELRKLDLLIRIKSVQLGKRSAVLSAFDASPPLYISEEEVDHLLSPRVARDTHASSALETEAEDFEISNLQAQLQALQTQINERIRLSHEAKVFLSLPQLAQLFSLSPFELQIVIIVLAPELDRKYDTLYAYLQDDITRKKPSIDLVLDLLCRSQKDRWRARAVFAEESPLFHCALLETSDDHQSPSGASDLARFLKLDPRILAWVLGNDRLDGRLTTFLSIYEASGSLNRYRVNAKLENRLLAFSQHYFSKENDIRGKLIFHLKGSVGSGKKELSQRLCESLNATLLVVDLKVLFSDETQVEKRLKSCFREALLRQAAVYLDGVDDYFNSEKKLSFRFLFDALRQYGWLCFLAGEKDLFPVVLPEGLSLHPVLMPLASEAQMQVLWRETLLRIRPESPTNKDWAKVLSKRFQFSALQIQQAARSAQDEAQIRGEAKGLMLADLFAACRAQSNQKLRELGVKMTPRYLWDDLVLPEDKRAQLRDICNQVKHRSRVFGSWGFDRKLSQGKGLSVLFSGPPGTGKTMAAEVIAHALELDLYKIDLSSLVSKYIGETEKNLSKIFFEAESSNAILFFDEADALFGKRTEVSDAHDRYANIETSYLLQKMEEYEGLVLLASNLRDNMDDAFTRRIRFIVEFPFPDTKSRGAIWTRHFPKEAPLADDIDLDFLAKRVQLAGGNIKNIVLNAAFLAAEADSPIGMAHLIQGIKQEYEKIGKLWRDTTSLQQLGRKRS